MVTTLQRVWGTAGWLLAVAIVYLSLTPTPVELPAEGGDKYAHLISYLLLSWWFLNLHESGRRRVLCIAGCLALGLGLEFAQRLTATRTFELGDLAANATGVLIGVILAPPRAPNLLRLIERLAAAR